MEILVTKGRNTILAHLEHLRDHNEQEFLQEAINYLKENNIDMSPKENETQTKSNAGVSAAVPGSKAMDFHEQKSTTIASRRQQSQTRCMSLRNYANGRCSCTC